MPKLADHQATASRHQIPRPPHSNLQRAADHRARGDQAWEVLRGLRRHIALPQRASFLVPHLGFSGPRGYPKQPSRSHPGPEKARYRLPSLGEDPYSSPTTWKSMGITRIRHRISSSDLRPRRTLRHSGLEPYLLPELLRNQRLIQYPR